MTFGESVPIGKIATEWCHGQLGGVAQQDGSEHLGPGETDTRVGAVADEVVDGDECQAPVAQEHAHDQDDGTATAVDDLHDWSFRDYARPP